MYSVDKFCSIIGDDHEVFFVGPDILEVLTHVSNTVIERWPPHTSIVLKNIEAAWAACCTPSTDAHCATLKRRPEATMPVFTAQSLFVVLGVGFGLLGWTNGFLVAFTCFFGGIGIVVFNRIWWTSCFILFSHAPEAVRRPVKGLHHPLSTLPTTTENAYNCPLHRSLQSKREEWDVLWPRNKWNLKNKIKTYSSNLICYPSK